MSAASSSMDLSANSPLDASAIAFLGDLERSLKENYDPDDVVVAFHVDYTRLGLQRGVLISITGAPDCLGAWDVKKSLPINQHGGLFIHLSKSQMPLEFKFIIRKDISATEHRILWQKGANFSIGELLPDRKTLNVQFFLGEVTDWEKKPLNAGNYEWAVYQPFLTTQSSCEVVIETDHMYLDAKSRSRTLLRRSAGIIGDVRDAAEHIQGLNMEKLYRRLLQLHAEVSILRDSMTMADPEPPSLARHHAAIASASFSTPAPPRPAPGTLPHSASAAPSLGRGAAPSSPSGGAALPPLSGAVAGRVSTPTGRVSTPTSPRGPDEEELRAEGVASLSHEIGALRAREVALVTEQSERLERLKKLPDGLSKTVERQKKEGLEAELKRIRSTLAAKERTLADMQQRLHSAS
eukprot:tig00000823_g4556.t1